MKGRIHHFPPPAAAPRGTHPAREELMCLLDGELAPCKAREIVKHLEVCEDCQRILDRYQAVRASFSDEDLFPELPTAGAERPVPVAEVALLSFPLSGPRNRRLSSGLAASLALLASGLLLWQLVLAPPGVSAREIIQRARIEEQRPLLRTPSAVVERTLRTTRRVRGVVDLQIEHQESWPRAAKAQVVAEDPNPLQRQIADAIPGIECAQLDPLSAGMMDCLSKESSADLRVLVPPKEWEGGFCQVTINNLQPWSGNPFTSVWTLRLSDWHLTRVDFRFFQVPNDVEFGVEELSYRVFDTTTTASLTNPAPVPPAHPVVPQVPEIEAVTGEHAANLKADFFLVLHSVGITLEDDVEIHFEDRQPIRVRVLVADAARKQAFIEKLARLSHVNATVFSSADATEIAQANEIAPVSLNADPQAGSPGTSMRSQGPLLLDELATHFGGGEHGREAALGFGISVIDQTQALQFQARWLARVRSSFSEKERKLLAQETRRALDVMELSLLGELSASHELLRQQVHAVLCPHLCDAASGLSSQAVPASKTSDSIEAQADQDTHLSLAMEREFAALKVLFVDRGFAGAPSEAISGGPSMSTSQQQVRKWLEASARVVEGIGHWQPKSSNLVQSSSR